MALPTIAVTPGSGQTINTLPNGGQASPSSSLPVVLDATVETAPGTPGTAAIAIQGNASGVAVPMSAADGGIVAIGAKADTAAANPAASSTVIQILKGYWTNWLARVPSLGAALSAASVPVVIATDQTVAIALDTSLETNVGTPGTKALTVQGSASSTPLPVKMPFGATAATSQVSVTTSVVQIAGASTSYAHREFFNSGSDTIFIGGSGVTTTTGYPVLAGSTYDFSQFTGALYGTAASGSQLAATIQY